MAFCLKRSLSLVCGLSLLSFASSLISSMETTGRLSILPGSISNLNIDYNNYKYVYLAGGLSIDNIATKDSTKFRFVYDQENKLMILYPSMGGIQPIDTVVGIIRSVTHPDESSKISYNDLSDNLIELINSAIYNNYVKSMDDFLNTKLDKGSDYFIRHMLCTNSKCTEQTTLDIHSHTTHREIAVYHPGCPVELKKKDSVETGNTGELVENLIKNP